MQEHFDVVVVGAGLAGLVAGLKLQRAGVRVLILERRTTAGGLCGTREIDGYEFVVACNDFGRGLERTMVELGVPIRFQKKSTRFYLADQVYQMPPDLPTALRLLPHAADIVRLIGPLRRTGAGGEEDRYLGRRVAKYVRNATFADLVNILGYPAGTPPDVYPVEALITNMSKEFGYGLDQPTLPEGGPGVLVAEMVRALERYDGTLRLQTECLRIEKEGRRKLVRTPQGTVTADEVISSEGRWECYPAGFEPTLSVSALLLAVRKDLPYPEGVHTLMHIAPGVSDWLNQLYAGEQPVAFGFHVFRSDLPARPDHYTLNVYFFLPRGLEDPPETHRTQVETYILEHSERMLPGLSRALLYKRFLSPRAFFELHGLSSQVNRFIMKPGFRKPDPYDPEREIYHIGNSVYPPGEHAGGAILSGLRAADRVLQARAARR